MDMATLISEILQDEEGVDPLDAYYSPLRAEILRRVKGRSDDLWYRFDWPFKKTPEAVVTLSSGVGGGIGDLPSGFQAFGHQMVVTIQGIRRPPLRWRPLNEILAERASWQGTTAYPMSFGYYDENTLGVKRIIMGQFTVSPTNVLVTFNKVPPVLVDSGAPSGLEQWPIAYHTSVIKLMGVQEMMKKKGDVRAETSKQEEVEAAIGKMATEEIPSRGAVKRMPPHPAARRHYGMR